MKHLLRSFLFLFLSLGLGNNLFAKCCRLEYRAEYGT